MVTGYVNVEKAEYALTPLNANEYERGMITFVTFLHILLVVLGGGHANGRVHGLALGCVWLCLIIK